MGAKVLLSVLIAVSVVTGSFAGDDVSNPPELSFAAFMQKVLVYYPRLKAARSDVDVAIAQQMQAKAGFWPSLNLSAGYKVTDDPVNVFGLLLRQERFTNADFEIKRLNTPDRRQDFTTGIHLEWPVFDAMQTIHRVRAAREGLKAAESDEEFIRMEALLVAQDAYLNAVTLEKVLMAVDEVQKNSDDDLQKAKDLKEKGMILGADYYAARVMFGDFTRLKNEILRQKKAMQALLNILMGEAVHQEWSLVASFGEQEVLPQDPGSLLAKAFHNRPDLAGLGQRLKAAGMDISRERSTILPNLHAFGEATNDRNKFSSAGGNNYTVGLKAEMSFLDPSRAGRVQQASARKVRLEHEIQMWKDRTARDIAEETARHESVRDNLGVLKTMSEDAREAVALMAPLYNEGRKSVADLMVARRAYLQAVEAYEKAVTGAWLSEARLLFLTGQLTEDAMKTLAQRSGL